MRYVYHATPEGKISNLRFPPSDDYVLADGEHEGDGDVLPDPRDLPEYRPEANPVWEQHADGLLGGAGR